MRGVPGNRHPYRGASLFTGKGYFGQQHMRMPIVIKNTVSTGLLAIVGAIFVFKYSARLSDSGSLIAVVYAIGYMALFAMLWRIELGQYHWARSRILLIVALTAIVIGATLFITVSPEKSRVTRLPALVEWIERLLAGEFPWGTATENNPSGFPFLYIVALPFYYAGNVGYLEVVGVFLFSVAIVQSYAHTGWLPLAGLVMLPTFYYELLVRSELFFNVVFVIMLILLSQRYPNASKLNISFLGLATLFGLGLSTRIIIGLIYAGYYAYRFRKHIWHGILFSGITLLIFGLTLMPFIRWDSQVFFAEGPFSIQMAYSPSVIAVLFVIAAVIVGWHACHIRDVFFGEGVLLFVIVAIAFLSVVAQLGIHAAVIKDGFDITYFIFCTPFLLLSLEKPLKGNTLRRLVPRFRRLDHWCLNRLPILRRFARMVALEIRK